MEPVVISSGRSRTGHPRTPVGPAAAVISAAIADDLVSIAILHAVCVSSMISAKGSRHPSQTQPHASLSAQQSLLNSRRRQPSHPTSRERPRLARRPTVPPPPPAAVVSPTGYRSRAHHAESDSKFATNSATAWSPDFTANMATRRP